MDNNKTLVRRSLDRTTSIEMVETIERYFVHFVRDIGIKLEIV